MPEFFAAALAIALFGCSDGGEVPEDDAGRDGDGAAEVDVGLDVGLDVVAATPTWHDHIAPLLATHCGACHFEGGAALFPLTTYAEAAPYARLLLDAVENGRMPPWPPDPDCRDYANSRGVPEADVALLREWVTGGAPEGDPTHAAPIPAGPVVEFAPNLFAPMPEAYSPSADAPDDWRCFVLDAEFEVDTYVRASDVQPGSPLVHHVLVYALVADARPTIEAADAAEPGPGYTCFGGPGPADASSGAGSSSILETPGGLPTQIGAWVPGVAPSRLPDGAAMRIAAGSFIVMQVHYNVLAGAAESDRSVLALETTLEPPELLWRTVPVADIGIDIPAGESQSTHTVTVRNHSDDPVVIANVNAHMHVLATRQRIEIVRDDGAQECLLDIPSWDFNWQMFYALPDDDFVTVFPGDGVELTCVYDNSAANQPVVNGVQLQPRRVTWGESTFDEMCLAYLGTIRPFDAEIDAVTTVTCEAAATCLVGCTSVDCMLDCPQLDPACARCLVQSTPRCAPQCLDALLELRPCIVGCILGSITFGSSVDRCMSAECHEPYEEFTTCLNPFVADGTCDAVRDACIAG